MTDSVDDSTTFEQHRDHLHRLAYRMTGSVTEAEDIVQDAFLRWRGRREAQVDNPRAFLVRTTSRLCLDHLKSARTTRETYPGVWLPEPIVDRPGSETLAERAEEVSCALMIVLERLTPAERAALVLHDVFDADYDEIATTLDRSPSACRKLVSRARDHVRSERTRFTAGTADQLRLAAAFQQAAMTGNTETLSEVLADDAVLYSDGGGKVLAALNPIRGRDAISRFIMGVRRKSPLPPSMLITPALVNGLPGVVFSEDGQVVQTMAIETDDQYVRSIYIVRNPDKLKHVHHGVPNRPIPGD